MNRFWASWWPPFLGKRFSSHEAGETLFRELRTRLTLWYCGVLGAALVLFCVVLYFGVQYFLLAPISANAQLHARAHAQQWQTMSLQAACSSDMADHSGVPVLPPGQSMVEMVACFDQNGTLLQSDNSIPLPSAFLSNTLVKPALQQGTATDIVNSSYGPIYRYALAVPDVDANDDSGVVLIGESVQPQENALSLLLILLLSVGGVSLIGAGLGGLFLANRALAPARLAWANQQRFIADASHELRTPLTLLRADAEVLLRSREHLAEEDAALLEDIVTEAAQMATLTANMLTLARLDNSPSHREHEVVYLAELARTATRRVQALATQMDITLEITTDDTAVVIGDPTLLEQAIMVLLDNAIKYNRRGGHITVCVDTQEKQARLTISDTGIGIAPEHLSHLGERFYRVDKARSRAAGGTGLGLSIARSIATMHGGTLTLTSTPNEGTTATLMLPLAHHHAQENTSLDALD
jgi:signal transduction histidine kinase